MQKIKPFIIVLFMLFLSCKNEKEVRENESHTQTKPAKINVNTTIITPQTFNKQIISNGVVETANKADLHFKTSERIKRIYVKNGQQVSKGKLLASLDNKMLANQVKQAKIALKNAEVNLLREKIIFGIHKIKEKDANPHILKTVYSKSGYKEAKANLEKAQLQYQQSFLKAPFSGVISNIKTKKGNYITTSDVFCTLVGSNKQKTEVVFSVLEQELPFVKKGAKIQISTFADSNTVFQGTISEINPLVDENGLIQIKATIDSKNNNLLNGMHVKIIINNALKDVVVIPKTALVLRSNKEVVFTVKNNLAKWNYVTISDENSTQYAVKKGLKVGDTIIISNNLNLAHDALIKPNFIKQNK